MGKQEASSEKSRGVISESFLRGAGVPDVFIAQMKALVGAMST
jgi:hypothetical protein